MATNALTQPIIGCAYAVHGALGPGYRHPRLVFNLGPAGLVAGFASEYAIRTEPGADRLCAAPWTAFKQGMWKDNQKAVLPGNHIVRGWLMSRTGG